MFWENFVQLCNERGVKPTPVIRELGLSTGNISKWQSGSAVRSDVLQLVSEHFHVSIDFLVNGTEYKSEENAQTCISPDELQLITMYRVLPDATKNFVFGSVKQGYENEIQRIETEKRLLG